MAWHLRHVQGEMSAYENLAITNFYMGKIEKSDYYIDRVFRGKTEAMFSVIKKISMAYTKPKFKDLKVVPSKSDVDMVKTGAMKTQAISSSL